MHEWISIQSSLLGLLYRLNYVIDVFTTNAISYCTLDNPRLSIKYFPELSRNFSRQSKFSIYTSFTNIFHGFQSIFEHMGIANLFKKLRK
jgi:hypothetical protein